MKRPIPYLVFALVVFSWFDMVVQAHNTVNVSNKSNEGARLYAPDLVPADNTPPVVWGVDVPSGVVKGAGINLDFGVYMSEATVVNTSGGTPYLDVTLDIGGTVHASYLSGTGTQYLTFRYTIVAGNFDDNGIDLGNVVITNGGTLQDAAGNNANLTLTNVGNTASIRVDAIAPRIISVSVPAANTYKEYDWLEFTVNFDKRVNISGTPYLDLTLDTGGTVQATYDSGNSTYTQIVFSYRVVAGNLDVTGISLGASIVANGSTVKDVAGNNANLTLNNVGSTANVQVDAVAPTVTSVGAPSDGTYKAGENLDFIVHMSEATYMRTGGSAFLIVTLDTGGEIHPVYLPQLSGNTILTFRYTLVSGQQDLTGITVGSSISTNSYDLKDAAGNYAVTGLNNVGGTSNVLVDAIAPVIASVGAPANGSYKEGANLDFTVNMSETTTVDCTAGTPYINLILDTGTVHATYLSGSGSSALTFRYTVVSGDKADWGIGITGGSNIVANGGIITDIAGNTASLYLNGGTFSKVLVDTTVPTAYAVYWPNSGTYKTGANLDFTVSMSENTIVSGTPYLEVTMDTGGTVQAAYLSGSGTNSLKFRYTVAAGNLDHTGIEVGSSIILNGGSLTDAAGHNAAVTISNNNFYSSTVYVDAVGPVVTSVEVPAGSTYIPGQTLYFLVHFDEATYVAVNGGWPYIDVTLETGGTVRATYESRNGSVLTFKCRINSGYLATNGITLGSTIILNGGLIYDYSQNGASLALTNIASTANVKVDGVGPTVSTVTVPANGTYVAGQNLDFTVTMSEATTVDLTGGTPYLGVNLDTGGTVQAAYLSGSGTSTLVYRYTVVSGNNDLNGIVLAGSITVNSGTMKDAVGNDAVLTLNSVGSTSNVRVDAAGPTVSSVTVPANGSYVAGQNLDFTVNMSESTTVDLTGGSPYLNVTLDTGGTVHAAYLSGTGTSALTFRYTVVSGNLDQTGIAVASPMISNGSTLKDALNNSAVPGLNWIGNCSGVKVDAVAPTVSSVSIPASKTYVAGNYLDFTVNMSENTIVTGTPYLGMTLDTGGTVRATYTSGSGTAALKFRYTVVTGNLDTDGIVLASVITANGGTLKDAAGNNAVPDLVSVGSTENVRVDGIAPVVTSLGLPADGTYITGQNLDFTVNMNEATIVDASSSSWVPTIDISFDTGSTAPASYFSGSGTSSLVFRYTVQSGKIDLTGISLSNTMYKDFWTTIKDAAGNNAVLALNGVGSSAGVLVDAVAPSITSVSLPSAATYVAGLNLDFTVNFNEATVINTSGGTPFLGVTFDRGGTVQANYLGGSGTTALSFRYTVVAGNLDLNGPALVSPVTANGGTLKDAAGNNAALTFNNWINTSDVKVDAAGPVVVRVDIPSGTYAAGQNLDLIVNFDEDAYVSGGTPYLNVTLDTGGTVHASYLEGSGTSALTFRYTVVSGNLDATGILVGSLIANGSTLMDAAGNNADFTLNSVASTANVLVDGVAPMVSSVSSSSANGTYKTGDVIPVTVIFSEAVNVTGTPALALNSGSSAGYTSGSGTGTLTFSYTVGSGHSSSDLDYAATGSLSLSGGTINDLPGNDAILTLPAIGGAYSLGGQKNIVVDGIQPAVTSVSSTSSNGNYLMDNALAITVSFSEAVTVTGTPVLALNSGGTASYSSGSATNVLNFNYTVGAGQSSADLDYSSTSALSLDGGTITDVAGNNAILTLPDVGAAGSLGANKNLVIGIVPAVSTQAATNIAATTATAAGTITVPGFPNPTAYGVCWSTTPSPTVANTQVNLGAKSSTGAFSTPLTGLSEGTVYYLRAFATNSVGTGYGNEVTFRTLKQLTVTEPTISPKTYDGNTVAAVDQLGTLSGIIGSEEVSVIPEASFDNKNSGFGKTVTVSYTLSGADRDKYITPASSEVYSGIIRPKAIAIIPRDGSSKTYGDPDPAFSYSYSPSLLAGDLMTGSLSRKAGENVGIYELTIGSVNAGPNYTVNISSPVMFTIRKAPLTIRADAKTKSFGTENPLLTCQYMGWKYSDNESVLRSKPLVFTKVTVATSVGEYPDAISVSGAIGDNYDITCIPANFSVVRALLTVTANQASKIYGEPNPPLGFVYSGWVNADNESALSKMPVASTTITNRSAAGNYPGAITVSGGEDKNYSFTYVAADFHITPKQVVPSVTARSRCYDATTVAALTNQALSGVISPDDVSLVVGNASFSDSSPGHDKTVTADNLSLAGAEAANYILSRTSAVTKADIFAIPFSKISGPEQVCAGINSCQYSIDGSMVSCQWVVSSGGVITSGQGTCSISVDWNNSGPQTISVSYSNTNGCSANESAAINVMVNAMPPDPVITASGIALVSDAPQGNQWYYSPTGTGTGNAIPGANGPSYNPSQDGWYWTQVTLADCSSGLSNKLYRINPLGKNQYSLFPAPNHGEFTVSIVTPFDEEISLFIFDVAGHKIFELTGLLINGEFKKEINLRQVQSGFYSLVILSKDGKVTRKFNIIK